MSFEIARFDLEGSSMYLIPAPHTYSDIPEAGGMPPSTFVEVKDSAEHDHDVCQEFHYSKRYGRNFQLYTRVLQMDVCNNEHERTAGW
jgi:hypothetical protein